ncbi:hypothetical protein ACJX0J_029911, partial [Zea mays]
DEDLDRRFLTMLMQPRCMSYPVELHRSISCFFNVEYKIQICCHVDYLVVVLGVVLFVLKISRRS